MKVLVKAYIAGNLGDDLMIRLLCNRYPETIFEIVGKESYSASFANINNIRYIYSDSFSHKIFGAILGRSLRNRTLGYNEWLLVNSFSSYKSIVIIGGSLFMENLVEKARERCDKLWLKRKALVIGSNFGPYYTNEYLQRYRKYFTYSEGIVFRDYSSYSLFQDLGNVKIAPDVVFNYKTVYKISNDSRIVPVVVASAAINKKQINDYVDSIVTICKIAEEENLIPTFICFCKAEGDVQVVDRVLSKLEASYDCIVYDGSNWEKIERIFVRAHTVVAGRFHALVLALLFNKRFIPINYSNKMSNLLVDVGYLDYSFEVKDMLALDIDAVRSIFASKDPIFKLSSDYIRASEHQFSFLDKKLKADI